MPSTAEPKRGRLADIVLRIERVGAVALLILVLGLTVLQVVARFVFESPFFWTEELARFGYVWLTFLAAMAAMADRSHITVQLWEHRLPGWARLGLNVGAIVAVALCCVVLLAGSWTWLGENTGASAAIHLPNVVFYGLVWAAFAAIAVHALAHIGTLVHEHRAGAESTGRREESAL